MIWFLIGYVMAIATRHVGPIRVSAGVAVFGLLVGVLVATVDLLPVIDYALSEIADEFGIWRFWVKLGFAVIMAPALAMIVIRLAGAMLANREGAARS